MAKKDDIKRYGNRKEIENAQSTVRGERISKKDKRILSQPVNTILKFGEFNENKTDDQFLELHIYDESGHRIESIYNQTKISWKIQKARGSSTTGNRLVLKPGEDLRSMGYEYGSYQVVYNVFEELLGRRSKHEVYIQEISPSRKEIRVLPTIMYPKATGLDSRKKPYIGAKGYPPLTHKKTAFQKGWVHSLAQWNQRKELSTYHLKDRRFIHDFAEFSMGRDSDTWVYNKGKIFTSADSNKEIVIEGGKFEKHMEGGKVFVFDKNDDEKIIYQTKIKKVKSGGRRATVWSSHRRGGVQTIKKMVQHRPIKLPKSNFEIRYIRSELVKKDDLKNLAVFGNNRNLLITNWELDNITFDDYPFSAIIRLYEPLPADIQLKDKFHIVREVTPPIIENLWLDSGGGEIDGNLLRPPNYDVDPQYLTDASRPTQYETWEELVSGDAATSERIIDKMISDSTASVHISVDYSNWGEVINYSSDTERLKYVRNPDIFNVAMEILDEANFDVNDFQMVDDYIIKIKNGHALTDKKIKLNDSTVHSTSNPSQDNLQSIAERGLNRGTSVEKVGDKNFSVGGHRLIYNAEPDQVGEKASRSFADDMPFQQLRDVMPPEKLKMVEFDADEVSNVD